MFHRIKNLFSGQKLERQKQRLSKPEYAYLFDTPLSKVPNEWVSLDLEMTGLNAKQDYILSVGAVQVRKESNGFVIDTDSALSLVCRPPVMPTHDTIVIHGLRPIDVDNGLSYDEMLTQLLPMLKNRPIIGFCVDMDMAFLNAIAKPFLGVELANKLVDVSRLYQQNQHRHDPSQVGQIPHLNKLLEEYQIPRLPAHNALNDAIMTAMLFTHLMKS